MFDRKQRFQWSKHDKHSCQIRELEIVALGFIVWYMGFASNAFRVSKFGEIRAIIERQQCEYKFNTIYSTTPKTSVRFEHLNSFENDLRLRCAAK